MRKVTVWPPALGDFTEIGNCCRIDEWRISTTQSVSANWQSPSIAGRRGGSRWSRRNRRARNRMQPRQRASDGIGNRATALPDGCFQRCRICGTPNCFSPAGAGGMGLAPMILLCIAYSLWGSGSSSCARAKGDAGSSACPTERSFTRTISDSQGQRWCFAPASMVCGANRTALSGQPMDYSG